MHQLLDTQWYLHMENHLRQRTWGKDVEVQKNISPNVPTEKWVDTLAPDEGLKIQDTFSGVDWRRSTVGEDSDCGRPPVPSSRGFPSQKLGRLLPTAIQAGVPEPSI